MSKRVIKHESRDEYTNFNGGGDTEVSLEYENEFFCNYNVQGRKTIPKKRLQVSESTDLSQMEMTQIEGPLTSRAMAFVDYTQEGSMALIKTHNFSDNYHGIPMGKFKSKHIHKHISANEFSANDILISIPKYTYNPIRETRNDISVMYIRPVKFWNIMNSSEISMNTSRFLDIKIGKVVFGHHPEFSVEQILTKYLVDCCEEYKRIKSKITSIENDLDIRRNVKCKLKEQFKKLSGDENSCYREPTFATCMDTLNDIKKEYKLLVRRENECYIKVTYLWSDIQSLSNSLGKEYDVELIVKEEFQNHDDYKQKYIKLYELELEDRIDELLLEYSQEKGKKSTKRKFIEKTQRDKIHDYVEEFLNEVCSQEPFRKIELIFKNRSQRVNENHMYFFKITVDDIEVCETKRLHMINDMVNFEEILSIQISDENSFVKMCLFDEANLIFSYSIDIETIKEHFEIAQKIKYNFSVSNKIKTRADYVGAAVDLNEIAKHYDIKLKCSQFYLQKLYTNGTADFIIGWHDKHDDSFSIAPNLVKLRTASRKITKKNDFNDKTLEAIVKSVYTDKIMVESLLDKVKSLKNIENYWDDLQFHDYDSNIFSKYLKTNTQNHSEDELLEKMVAHKDSDYELIEKIRLFGNNYLERMQNQLDNQHTEEDINQPLKNIVVDYQCNLVKNIFTCNCFFVNPQNNKFCYTLGNYERSHKSMTLLITVMKAFYLPEKGSKSKVNDDSTTKDRQNVKEKTLRPFVKVSCQGKSAQTSVAVGSYPTWNETLSVKIKRDDKAKVSCNIYDEVVEDLDMFAGPSTGAFSKTINRWIGGIDLSISGILCNPHTEGIFKINKPPELIGYSSENENQISFIGNRVEFPSVKDSIYLTLNITTLPFDKVSKTVANLPPGTEENNNLKECLRGFSQSYTKDFPNRNLDVYFVASSGKRGCLSKLLHPLQIPDLDLMSRNERRGSIFSKSSTSLKSKREVDEYNKSGSARDSDYNTIQMRKMRNNDLSLETIMKFCARYVSLIPTVENASSITLTGPELLNVSCGSNLDHVVLLACYFMYLGVRCWIVCGKSFSKEKDFFLLIKYSKENGQILLTTDLTKRSRLKTVLKGDCYTYIIFDAVSSEVYNLQDEVCPLKTIHYAFDDENIFANVQASCAAQSTRLDFTQTSDWMAAFSKSAYFNVYPSFESELYTEPIDVDALRIKLEMKIKCKVEKWRLNSKTVWHRYCSVLLQETISAWETWAWNKSAPKPHQSQKLEQFLWSYEPYGFIVNMPFFNIKKILTFIKTTDVYKEYNNDLEFALSVEIFSYPCAVLSVWVYFLVLKKNFE